MVKFVLFNSKVQAILDFPVPTTKKELCRFLGMTGYYRCFCKNLSVVASPLTKLLSKAVSFKWSPECQLKTLLCSATVLAAPCFEKPFLLEVDASGSSSDGC